MTIKTMEVSRELLDRVTNNQHLEKERISIARHEALFELRGLLAKTACIDCKETGFCMSITGDEIRCPCHAPIQFAKPAELQAEPAAQPQAEPLAWLNVATGHVTTSAIVVMDWDDEKEQVQSLYAEQPAPVAVVPELTSELRWILGQMCFQHIHTAQALRLMGHEIAKKAEDEQAVTIYWMLGHYLKDPANWRQNATAEMKAAAPTA